MNYDMIIILFLMQMQMLLSVLASVRVLAKSLPPILAALEMRIVSLTVPTQHLLLPVPMPTMLESTALKHVSY